MNGISKAIKSHSPSEIDFCKKRNRQREEGGWEGEGAKSETISVYCSNVLRNAKT